MKKIFFLLILSILLVGCNSEGAKQLKDFQQVSDQIVKGLGNTEIDAKTTQKIEDTMKELEIMAGNKEYSEFKKTALNLYSQEITFLVNDLKQQKSIKESDKCGEQIEKAFEMIRGASDGIDGLLLTASNTAEEIALPGSYMAALAGMSTVVATIHMIPFCTIDVPNN